MERDKVHIAEFLVLLVAVYVFGSMVNAYDTTASTTTDYTYTTTTNSGSGDSPLSSTTTLDTTASAPAPSEPKILYISPQQPTIKTGDHLQFKGYIAGTEQTSLEWKVLEGSLGGSIAGGLYTAPAAAGIFHIYARDYANYSYGSTTVIVLARETHDTTTVTATTTTTTTTSTATTTTTTTTATASNASTTTTAVNSYTASTSSYTVSTTPTYVAPTVTYPAAYTQTVGTVSTAGAASTTDILREALYPVIQTLSESASELAGKPTTTVAAQEVDSLYIDTNKDGISDYESRYIYNLDPKKPSPTTVYQGKKLTAGEKVLLGLDPTAKEAKKIEYEEPASTTAPVIARYVVREVRLAQDKKVVIAGRALPNSFVTVYIYSMPIIVTVKADSAGEWRYELDQELEDGRHQVYTATVNNTGKIVAKSREYSFTKTAEAATLEYLPPTGLPTPAQEPSIFKYVDLYVIIIAFVTLFAAAIAFIGMRKISKAEEQVPPQQ